jgi:N-glycosylase/DNA lyase
VRPSLVPDFDPEISVNSGQAFLWQQVDRNWYGVHGDCIVKFSKSRDGFEFSSFPERKGVVRDLFRLDDDVDSISAEMSRDPLIAGLLKTYGGLRLMRQDSAQCLFSFVCATNTNIPMIRRMLYTLAKKYGQKVTADGMEFHTFPSAEAMSKISEPELRACGLGYRAKAVMAVAQGIESGTLDLAMLKKTGYADAKQELLKIYGVGPKLADCVLLFSLDKLEAFPIDIWIARALATHYGWLGKFGEKLTTRQYEELSESARKHFGRHAGYAQQYLYYHMRQGKKW